MQELNTSKRGYIDRFPGNFATKAQIAGTLPRRNSPVVTRRTPISGKNSATASTP